MRSRVNATLDTMCVGASTWLAAGAGAVRVSRCAGDDIRMERGCMEVRSADAGAARRPG